MRIRNSGGLPLRSLALVVGHPEAVVPATDANKDRPLLDSLTGEAANPWCHGMLCIGPPVCWPRCYELVCEWWLCLCRCRAECSLRMVLPVATSPATSPASVRPYAHHPCLLSPVQTTARWCS